MRASFILQLVFETNRYTQQQKYPYIPIISYPWDSSSSATRTAKSSRSSSSSSSCSSSSTPLQAPSSNKSTYRPSPYRIQIYALYLSQFHFLHETGLGIIMGFAVGAIIYFKFQDSIGNYNFQEKIFFYGLLPPMIFEGGYNLRKKLIFKNFTYISIFGIIGTLVAFFVILGLTMMVNSLGWIRLFSDFNQTITLSTASILLYSATICATDSVAALTMLKPSKYPKLFSIIFGEGMINDAVAIILFRSVSQIFGESHHEPFTIVTLKQICGSFLVNLLFSFLVGLGSAVACALTFKKLRFLQESTVVQVVLTYLFGIFSYALSQSLEYSGVISVFVCGITMGHYNFYNLSPMGQLSTVLSYKTISFSCEAFLFVFLGISSWNYFGDEYTDYEWSWTFVICEIAICALARIVAIFALSGLFYLCMKKKWKVNVYELGVICFAGIIRGSVAFALILTLEEPEDSHDPVLKQIQIIKSSVLFIVFVTTILGGALMPSFVNWSLTRASEKYPEPIEAQPTEEELEQKKKKKAGCFKTMDDGFFKVWLIHDYENRLTEIQKEKKEMKLSSEQFVGAQGSGERAHLFNENES